MANLLDESEITLTQAMNNYFRYGIPVPAHLRVEVQGMKPIVGVEPAKDYPLGAKYRWNKPFYNKGGKGHDGNGNPMHGTMSNRARV